MPFLSDVWFRIKAVLRPGAMERELDQEVAFHVDMEAEKLVKQGMAPDAAANEAKRRFGGDVRPRQLARDSWGIGVFRDAVVDVRHALRQFRRRPGFSILGITTLGLGLAATIGLFGVIQSLLIRPLPIADDNNVRVFWSDYNWRGVEFDYLRERSRAFSEMAAFSADGTTLRSEVGSSVLLKGVTSHSFFNVLGVPPLMGRTFIEGEDRPGAEPVAVVSYDMWQRELGADPQIISRRITLDGKFVTVVGVMPKGFYFPTPEFRLWTPLNLDPASDNYQNNGWLVLIGRVAPEVNEAQVDQDIAAMAQSLGERFTYPAAWDKTKNAGTRTAREYLIGDVRDALLLVFGAGVLLLLMACANVAALVLARTTDRSQEMALRTSLGAGRSRLVRQIVVESLVFALLAAAVGATAAALGFKVLLTSMPLNNNLQSTVAMDWSSFVIALVLAAAVGLLVAIAPVRALLRGKLEGISGTRGATAGKSASASVHRALVSVEAGVAVVLVAGAMLFVRSVSSLLDVDLGFDPRGVVAIDVSLVGDEFTDPQRTQLFSAIQERVARLPGVTSAAWTNRLPIRDGGWQGPVSVMGNPELQGSTSPNALFRQVSEEYFETMRIPILQGRGLTAADRMGSQRVALINKLFAERAWPGQDPLGRSLVLGVNSDSVTVVGVVDEVRSTAVTGEAPFVTYVADAQGNNDYRILVIRGAGLLSGLPEQVRRIAFDLDPRIATNRPTTMQTEVRTALAQPLQLRLFLSLFGALALTLGMVGIYSVASYSVARRRAELGVRMALGATPQQVRRQIVREAVVPVAIGTGAGLIAAVIGARGAADLLYGVSALDPASLSLAAAALLSAGVLAALVPARRAATVSPIDALASE